jgi:hypothetical protein
MNRPPTSPKVRWEHAAVEPRILKHHPRFERYIVRSCHGAMVATIERRAPGEPWRALTLLPHAVRVATTMDRVEAERAVERILEREIYVAPGLAKVIERMAEEAAKRSITKGEWLN